MMYSRIMMNGLPSMKKPTKHMTVKHMPATARYSCRHTRSPRHRHYTSSTRPMHCARSTRCICDTRYTRHARDARHARHTRRTRRHVSASTNPPFPMSTTLPTLPALHTLHACGDETALPDEHHELVELLEERRALVVLNLTWASHALHALHASRASHALHAPMRHMRYTRYTRCVRRYTRCIRSGRCTQVTRVTSGLGVAALTVDGRLDLARHGVGPDLPHHHDERPLLAAGSVASIFRGGKRFERALAHRNHEHAAAAGRDGGAGDDERLVYRVLDLRLGLASER